MKNFTKLIGILMLLSTSYNLFAKEIRPSTGINAIDSAIKAAEPGDVIILENGKIYYHETTIEITVPITIRTEDLTEGARQAIIAFQAINGIIPTAGDFIVKSDIMCENIIFHGGGAFTGKAKEDVGKCLTWSTTVGMKAVFKRCIWLEYDQRTLVLEAPDMKLYASDCMFINDHKVPGPSEGRSIDFRQYGPDTVIIQNCSFLNSGNRFFRHMPSSGKIDAINYMKVDHCTFVNGAGYHPCFDFGTIEELVFTNNIVQNVGLMGSDFTVQGSKASNPFIIAVPADYYSTDQTKRPYRLSEVYYDRADGITVFACHGVDTIGTQITMTKNNIYNIPDIAAKLAENDTVSDAGLFCSQFSSKIAGGASGAYTEEALDFLKGDELVGDGFNWLDSIMDPYFGYWDKNQAFVMPKPDYFKNEIDLSYGTTAAAYTAADGGYPLGDLNWYPVKKCEWAGGTNCGGTTSITEVFNRDLISVYPNPASHYIQISMDVEKPVSFKMFNMGGQLVYSNKLTNSHTVDLKKAGIGRGMYLYAIEAKNQIITGKIVVE
jgi:hypothetical protein